MVQPVSGLTRLVRPPAAPAPTVAPPAPAPSSAGDQLQPLRARSGAVPGARPVPVTSPVVRQGDQFMLEGQPFRFAGMNAYDLAWIAERDPAELERTLRTIAGSGANVVRFWAFPGRSPEAVGRIFEASQRLGLGLRFIPVLGNHWDSMEVGTEARTKDRAWYGGGFRQTYLPHVAAMVRAHGQRPEVLIWEVINEPVTPHLDQFYRFVREASGTIKANGGRMASVGSFGSVQAGQVPPFYRALANLPDIDAVSMHDYAREWGADGITRRLFSWWGDRELALNGRIAQDVGKPYYIGEVGTKLRHCGWRIEGCTTEVRNLSQAAEGNVGRAELAYRNGAQGVLLWGPQPEGHSQDGHGFGFTFRQEDEAGSLVRTTLARMHASANATARPAASTAGRQHTPALTR